MIRKTFAFLTLALLLPLAACDDGLGVEGPRTVSILLTDAPGDFHQAWVTIESVELVGDEDSFPLREVAVTTDLIEWNNDVMTLVEPVAVPAGDFSQLRLVISGACVVLEGEGGGMGMVYASEGYAGEGAPGECATTDHDLQLPSWGQSGLKLNLPAGALTDAPGDQAILLDFIVPESFGHPAGNSGKMVMRPVVKVENVSFTGSITVELTIADTVSLAGLGPVPQGQTDPRDATLEDFQARITGESEAIMFEESCETVNEVEVCTGTATFLFQMPGDYDVAVELVDGVTFDFTLNPESPVTETLDSGESATVSFEITSAAAPAT